MAASLRVATRQGGGPDARYFGWTPVPCELRGVEGGEGSKFTIGQEFSAGSGRLLFGTDEPTEPELTIARPASGKAAKFIVGGEFGKPSTVDGDVKVVISDRTGQQLAAFPVMVRVRKNANELDGEERDRFLRAFAAINNAGQGVFRAFRRSHSLATVSQAHGNAAFLPWHRAFLLDLERELQRVDPSVALPYWRFDRKAPRVFTRDYMGAADQATGAAQFRASNPLSTWSTDGATGVQRLPRFNTQTSSASGGGDAPIEEGQVTKFKGKFEALPSPLELNPHASAHVSFAGFVEDLEMAARDPLFYLLHCNVDRLWAKWQWLQKRMDPGDPKAFGSLRPNGQSVPDGNRPPGHNLGDTMWPWNGITSNPRPNFSPRTPFASGVGVKAPGAKPKVRSMIDYQGVHQAGDRLGFDYDDVPYQP
jgi:tyrosinase